jgi:nitroreductase/NAD-dependent dihydropyrimidine dehydrogenase PreA subunit
MAELEPILGTDIASKFEELKPMLRPTGIINGMMKADPEKCNHCGRCLKNCPFQCWETDQNKVPQMKKEYICFSCGNCLVACREGAISFVQTYKTDGGFFDTQIPPYKLPLQPEDEKGGPSEWTEMERLIIERRSVRNFKKDPVPDPLIRRVLEAGRFAPSGGNMQPWRFTVVTDTALIQQLEEACQQFWAGVYSAYQDEEGAVSLASMLPTGVFDPRVQYGIRCVAKKELPVFFKAPVVIFISSHEKSDGPELSTGICGQNMNLAALALGLGFVWCNFGKIINNLLDLKARIGLADPAWTIQTCICIGYPAFKQRGIVPRQYRPVTWFRPGANGSEIEE